MNEDVSRAIIEQISDANARGVRHPIGVLLSKRFPGARAIYLRLTGATLRCPGGAGKGEQAVVFTVARSSLVDALKAHGGAPGKEVAARLRQAPPAGEDLALVLTGVDAGLVRLAPPATPGAAGEVQRAETPPHGGGDGETGQAADGLTDGDMVRLLTVLVMTAPGYMDLPERRPPFRPVRTFVDGAFIRDLLRVSFLQDPVPVGQVIRTVGETSATKAAWLETLIRDDPALLRLTEALSLGGQGEET
jgi:hypothetical protein